MYYAILICQAYYDVKKSSGQYNDKEYDKFDWRELAFLRTHHKVFRIAQERESYQRKTSDIFWSFPWKSLETLHVPVVLKKQLYLQETNPESTESQKQW